MTVFRAATLRTFFFAFHAGAKELSQLQEDRQYVRKFLASNSDSNSEADFE